LWYGDAEAHLNIARRILDSQTPGYDQIGTPWLPLPHLLMLPFARVDAWWRSGLAGAIPSAACFVAGTTLLFTATHRVFASAAAGIAAAGLIALNPNLLYLQTSAMTEPVFFAALMALLYTSVREWPAAAGLAGFAATLTRYDGWFLIPFAALWFLIRRGFRRAVLFGAIASLGPLYWLVHNWWLTGDALYFFHGPGSALAIQGSAWYPGKGSWPMAWVYYRTAVKLCAGPGLSLMLVVGVIVALVRRAVWPVVLLALPGLFYLWGMHSSGNPIHVPTLWPYSYYNTRYGLAVLPLLAFAAASIVMAVPERMRPVAAMLVIAAGSMHWATHHRPEDTITWAESRANSSGRRAWTQAAADYLRPRFVRGSGIISASGDDFAGIYRYMGIPLRETFSIANGLPWDATVQRPELYLWHEWAVAKRGDEVARAVARATSLGHAYALELTISERDEPVIEIYRRVGGL
jgi:hypothetical protein